MWIEIVGLLTSSLPNGSLSARRVWIEIGIILVITLSKLSLSARRVWIEILDPEQLMNYQSVTLREEGVD